MAAPAAFTRSNIAKIHRGTLGQYTSGEANTTAVDMGRVADVVIEGKPVKDEPDTLGRSQVVALNCTLKAVIKDCDDTMYQRILESAHVPFGYVILYNQIAVSGLAATSRRWFRADLYLGVGDNFKWSADGKTKNDVPIEATFQIHPSEWDAMFENVGGA